MSHKKDLYSIGQAYGSVLNGLKTKLVKEDKTVPVGEIGNAPLESGGPEERSGFKPAAIDIDRMTDKEKDENLYNIKGLTYGDGNDPGINNQRPEPTGPTYGQVAYTGNVGNEEDEESEATKKRIAARAKLLKRAETLDLTDTGRKTHLADINAGKYDPPEGEENEEDEEFLAEHEKIARKGLNNFMSKTSVFDKLYNKVMVSENFGEEVEDVTELEALGIETDEVVDEVPEEITVAIPGELAQALADILQTALAQQETEVDIDVDVTDVTDTEFEEDEEAPMKDGGGYGVDAGSTLTKEINYGKKNKVGKLRPATGLAQKDGGGYGVDAGSTLSKEIDYARKNNKVGTTKLGSIPGA